MNGECVRSRCRWAAATTVAAFVGMGVSSLLRDWWSSPTDLILSVLVALLTATPFFMLLAHYYFRSGDSPTPSPSHLLAISVACGVTIFTTIATTVLLTSSVGYGYYAWEVGVLVPVSTTPIMVGVCFLAWLTADRLRQGDPNKASEDIGAGAPNPQR